MTRKAFLADVVTASQQNISNVNSIIRGADDGDVNFTFLHDYIEPVDIGLLALDVSEYPAGNTYMIFTRSNGAPNAVTDTLGQLESSSAGLRLPDLIDNISQKLRKALATGSKEDPFDIDDEDADMDNADESDAEEEFDDEEAGFSDDDEGFLDERMNYIGDKAIASSNTKLSATATAQLNRRIKQDVRAVKKAGFRIGIVSGMDAESSGSILSISILAARLGLSEEAMQAWDIEPQQYIVLLVRYSNGYKSFDTIIAEAAKSSEIDFRIGVSNNYKPSNAAAFSAFSEVNKSGAKQDATESGSQTPQGASGFSNIFISSSLNDFINTKMISMLKIRNSTSLGWEAAKKYLDQRQGRPLEQNADGLSDELMDLMPDNRSKLSEILNSDHLTDCKNGSLSFPLLAAQFASMYLVRCTEFCLVCHDRIDGEFEALKPYVCSKPLCLYQYMALGFGPSVEHEIQTQPYCVDLLLNLCYTSAYGNRIREYPTGMSLSVPGAMCTLLPPTAVTTWSPGAIPNGPATPTTNVNVSDTFEVKFDSGTHEIVFDGSISYQPYRPIHENDWVAVMIGNDRSRILHFRVADASLFPTVKLSDIAVTQSGGTQASLDSELASLGNIRTTPAITPPPQVLQPARIAIYNRNFDDMTEEEKRATIVMLLETLPTVKEMKQYMDTQIRTQEPNLRMWKDRISPAALGLLRWVIASNRSCLIQVDKCPGQSDGAFADAKVRPDQKVSEITDDWVQFRFAQGAPDKEQRFLNALKAQQANLDRKYPTMFAFHGSPIHNWHSIIRHGLDFKDTLHGRAYGHGVYHALDQNVSVGYAAARLGTGWPGSQLKATSIMSINEIINCPRQFISSTPYLVIQHIDWIQCRYLLVQVDDGLQPATVQAPTPSNNTPSLDIIDQDPKQTATATNRKSIGIPNCAASISRAFRTGNGTDIPSMKKRRLGGSNVSSGQYIVSEEEDIEDIQFLLSDDEATDATSGNFEILCSKSKQADPSKTDFVPGSLDQASLPMLESPSYATPAATMRLNRELQSILKTQKSTPLHELGWYIDESLVDNIYQWIVELHSFDPSLQLSKDLKLAGLRSVVLEIRFGQEYPHTPPFVRVVRPRFLPFMNGGGGHVTAGGALCMELLTNSGWSAVSSIESVLLQVRLALMSTEPKPARLENTNKSAQRDYGTQEAMDAFIRACRTHGWEVPKDFNQFATATGSGW